MDVHHEDKCSKKGKRKNKTSEYLSKITYYFIFIIRIIIIQSRKKSKINKNKEKKS